MATKTKEGLSKNQFDSLIEEIKGEIDTLLKTEEEKLAKTAPGQESPSEDDDNADVSATAPAAPSGPAGDTSGLPGDDGAEASAPPAPEATAPAEGTPDASAGDPGMDTGMDHGALVAEYAKLPPEELKMHMLAAKEALMNVMGGDVGSEEPAAPAAPAPMAPPAAPPGPEASMSASAPPTLKGEMKADAKANGGPVPGMSKSEKDEAMEALQKTVSDQAEALTTLVKTVELVLGQPQRKAVTSVGFVPKTEDAPKPLSKSEVTEKLVTITKSPKLSKSDRELINEYCLGNLGVEKIEHLLK